MIAAGHNPAAIFDYTVPQFRLYLDAAFRREKRQFLDVAQAGRLAWADEATMKRLEAALLAD